MRVRRANSLALFFCGNDLICENYLTGRRTCLSPAYLPILAGLTDWTPRTGSLEVCATGVDPDALIDALVASHLLVEENSALADRDGDMERHWAWDVDARFFFFSTATTSFDADNERVLDQLQEKAAGMPPPSPFTSRGERTLFLPPAEPLELPLGACLARRRTCRRFQGQLKLQDLATLLDWTWGKRRLVEGGALGDVLLKSSPSGGARHPIEVYVLAQRIEGAAPGTIFHYDVRDHALDRIGAISPDHHLGEICSGQKWVEDAAAVFFMTAIVSRTMWKYQQSHALRVVLMEAGHLGQTFHLACAALGLGPFTSAAFEASQVEALLGIDGIREVPLYLGAAGKPA